MSKKRLRIFAGPNGSGKSTFIKQFPSAPNIKLGYYVNADDLEQNLKLNYFLGFNEFGINATTEQIQKYFKDSTFSPIKLNNPDLWKNFTVENNELIVNRNIIINSYIAADLAEFIRQQLLSAGLSFSYETVMSDAKKIDFLHKAKAEGYRIYLYYFATEDPSINIQNVKLRVLQKGHAVDEELIRKRYYKSLKNLKAAIKVSDRAYLFNNADLIILIAEITKGEDVEVIDLKNIPNWFINYLFDEN